MTQSCGDLREDAGPVAGFGLAEEFHRRVPRGIGAVGHPAPI